MWLWIERSFNGSYLDVDMLSQQTGARQKHDKLSSTKNASNFLESCVLHLACTSVSFLCGFNATSEDGILNSNLIQRSVYGEPLLLKCRLSQYSVGAEWCVLIHTLSWTSYVVLIIVCLSFLNILWQKTKRWPTFCKNLDFCNWALIK